MEVTASVKADEAPVPITVVLPSGFEPGLDAGDKRMDVILAGVDR
jgi:hypothetical protein